MLTNISVLFTVSVAENPVFQTRAAVVTLINVFFVMYQTCSEHVDGLLMSLSVWRMMQVIIILFYYQHCARSAV